MNNFYTDVIRHDHRFGSLSVCSDVDLLEPEFRAKILRFIAFAKSQGHTLEILETYRSQKRQQLLFSRGLTKLKTVGDHGYGLAADVALYINGKYDPKGQDYMFAIAAAKEAGVISGIDWGLPGVNHSFRDYDHLQGIPLFRQPALFAGSWYPPKGYNPLTDKIAHGVA